MVLGSVGLNSQYRFTLAFRMHCCEIYPIPRLTKLRNKGYAPTRKVFENVPLYNLELITAEIYNIAIQKYRNTEKPDKGYTEIRGYEL